MVSGQRHARGVGAELAHAFRTTGMRITATNPAAYAEGAIGWVIDRPTFETAAGGSMQTRMAAIFRREGDDWQVVHVHNSMSVPNAQVEGFEDFEVGNAAQPI